MAAALATTADLFAEVSAELAARRGLSTGIDDPPAVRRQLHAALAEASGPS